MNKRDFLSRSFPAIKLSYCHCEPAAAGEAISFALLKFLNIKLQSAIILFFIVFISIITPAKCANLELEIIPVCNIKASEALIMVEKYVSPQGAIFADDRTNRIFIKDNKENIEKIKNMLKLIDVKVPHVKIEVKFNGVDIRSIKGIDTTIYSTPDKTKVFVDAIDTSNETSINSTFSIMTMSGSPAWLIYNESTPITYVQWFYDYALNYGYINSGIMFENVSSGFFVIPYARGNNYIALDIVPAISYRSKGNSYNINFIEAKTTTGLYSGQTINIGLISSQKSDLCRKILGSINIGENSNFTITLTAKIIDI